MYICTLCYMCVFNSNNNSNDNTIIISYDIA